MHSVLQFYGTCSLVRSAIATECGIYDHSIHYIQDNLIRYGSTLLFYFIIINQEAKTIPSSKTLLSGNAKLTYFLPDPFPRRLMRGQECRTRIQKHGEFWTRAEGYDAYGNGFGAEVHMLH
jgi:hypothetical protein